MLPLQRIDALLDTLILGVYLVLLTGFVALAALTRTNRPVPDALRKRSARSTGAIQFLMSGLFSAYVIYYTRSASFSTASLFLLVLVALRVANELVWRRTRSVYLLIGVYFLAVFCYFMFLLPVVLGQMGLAVFLVSGFVSAGLVIALLLFLDAHHVFGGPRGFLAPWDWCSPSWAAWSAFPSTTGSRPCRWPCRTAVYFTTPTARVRRSCSVTRSRPGIAPGKPTTIPFATRPATRCTASLLSSPPLETQVYHHWQYYHPEREAWVDTDRIGYRVVGGRRRGDRGVTVKRNVRPGAWRVTTETAGRRPIGRVRFDVVRADSARTAEYVVRRYESSVALFSVAQRYEH